MTYMVVVERFFKEMHWLKWKKKKGFWKKEHKRIWESFLLKPWQIFKWLLKSLPEIKIISCSYYTLLIQKESKVGVCWIRRRRLLSGSSTHPVTCGRNPSLDQVQQPAEMFYSLPLLTATHCSPLCCFFFTNPWRPLFCHNSVPSLWQLNLPGKEAS